jgi:hypothetical protein
MGLRVSEEHEITGLDTSILLPKTGVLGMKTNQTPSLVPLITNWSAALL